MFRTARTLNVYIILLFTNKIKSQPVIEANRMFFLTLTGDYNTITSMITACKNNCGPELFGHNPKQTHHSIRKRKKAWQNGI